MILTCPDCATRYVVDDERIGPQGRAVRCAACGKRWTAMQQAAETLVLDHASDEPGVAPFPADIADDLEPRTLPADELPRAFRDKVQTQKKERQAAASGAIWAGMIGVLVLFFGGAFLLRQDVARLWPRTAGAYAMVGLPVNLVGLTIEGEHAQPALKDGHAAVVVSGSLRNVLGRPVAAPPLRISLLNTAGKAVLVKIADPGGARIPPGEVRRFSVDVLDPPVSASDVEIRFIVGRRSRGGGLLADDAPQLPGSDPPTLRGPAGVPQPAPAPAVIAPIAHVTNAVPEPSNSPYALPAAASPDTAG